MSHRPPDGYPSGPPPNPPATNPMNQLPPGSNAAPSAPPSFYHSGSQSSYSGHPQQQQPPPPNGPPSAQYGAQQPYAQPPPDGAYAHQFPPGHYAQAQYPYQQQPPPPQQPYGAYAPVQYMQQPQYAPVGYAPPGAYPGAPPQAAPAGQRQQYYGAPYAPQGYPAPPPGSPPQMAAAAPPGSYGMPPLTAAGSSAMFSSGAPGEIAVEANGLPVVSGDIRLVGPSKFKVEEKVLGGGGDSFYVKDAKNVERYTVDGSLTVVGHKVMKNASGRTLLQMKEARLTRKTRIVISDYAGKPIMTLQKQATMGGAKRVDGYVGGAADGVPAVVISGNRKNTDFTVLDASSRLIAAVTRKTATLKNMFTGQDSYDVTVQLGSPALLCLLVVAIDEFYAD